MLLACSLVVAASLSVTASAPVASAPVAQSVDILVFDTSLRRFITVADSRTHDRRLDWSTDGCSAPFINGTGLSFDFTPSCRRHDFAYRNYSRIDDGRHWTSKMRAKVDAVFRRDMLDSCRSRPTTSRVRCRAWADIFYRAVRIYGGP